ncbi:MAG: hypothetical protein L6R40_003536 [Gallowayella cf. fulva]|nr:MAG: hypothetical protein L6R40_003536 [Xanthomendoza cf. fulva]
MPLPVSFFTRITNALPSPNQAVRLIRRWVWPFAKVFFLGHIIADYVGLLPPKTRGPSMLPTLAADGDMVWISSRYRYGRGVKVGDMVSFKHPCVPDAAAIKRVVGMPGDFVMRDVHDGRNDTMLQVPEGHCWVLGDNLTESRDSRTYGPIPLGLVVGKVIAKNLPGFNFERFRNNVQRPPPDA